MAVYFIQDAHGHVKIGWSRSPTARLRAMQSARPDLVTLVRVVNGERAIEQWFHQRFATAHIRGEWFRFDPGMLTIIPRREKRAKPSLAPAASALPRTLCHGPEDDRFRASARTEADLLRLLRAKIDYLGSQLAFAHIAKVTPAYLTGVLKSRRPVGPTILKSLRLKRVNEYRKIA